MCCVNCVVVKPSLLKKYVHRPMTRCFLEIRCCGQELTNSELSLRAWKVDVSSNLLQFLSIFKTIQDGQWPEVIPADYLYVFFDVIKTVWLGC